MSTGRTILDLDDYTLRHVFSFLSDLEMVTVGYTCMRFRLIIGPLIGKKEIMYPENQTYGDPTRFYTNYGIYINKIWLWYEDYAKEIFDLVLKYCHNIESAGIHFAGSSGTEFVKKMFASNKNIKNLELFASYMTDIPSEHISRLQNLETLRLTRDHLFTGEYLNRLTNLKELYLEECRELNSEHFIGICKANELLKLNIIGCEKLNTEAFQTMVETQTELEEIYVDHWYKSGEVSQIAFLKKLCRIHIAYTYGLEDYSSTILKNLSEYRVSSLKYLTISNAINAPSYNDLERILSFTNLEEIALIDVSTLDNSFLAKISEACMRLKRVEIKYCCQITNHGILYLIRNLKLLSELNVENCPNLSGDLYQDICDAKINSDNKIKLKVHASNRCLFNISDDLYNMNRNLVELFYCSKPFKSV